MSERESEANAAGWSDEMLERLIDGEVTEEVSAALREELRRSPEARRELAEIRRTDALAAEVFDGILDGRMDRVAEVMELFQRRAMARVLAGAACVAVLVGGAFVLGRQMSGSSPAARSDARLVDAGSQESIEPAQKRVIEREGADSGRVVRTVFEMPVRPRHIAPEIGPQMGPEMGPAESGVETESVAQESVRERERRYVALGRTLRSADVARGVLDAMEGAEQLEVCRVWARDPSLRPVAFERLARLQNDPSLAGECARIATEMSEDRGLLAWARSHGLRTTTGTEQ